jgi:D-alanyl-D-alanine carboxypeptidase
VALRCALTVVLAALTVALTASVSMAAGGATASKRLTLAALLAQNVRDGSPGAVALVKMRRRTWRGASGYAELATRERMGADYAFRVSSITKTFVATVVLQLVAEGRLHLADSVDQWLPGVFATGREMTIRQLLQHTSGLADYSQDDESVRSFRETPGRVWTPSELLGLAARQYNGRAGGRPAYSNSNFLVLGLIIEAVTKRPLASELDDRIFKPLHLSHTFFATTPEIPLPHAHGYYPATRSEFPSPPWPAPVNGYQDSTVFNPSALWGSTNIVSSAPDLATFFAALLGGRLLPRVQLAAMETTIAGPGWRFGLGLLAKRLRCGLAWGNWGYVLGYYTYALFSKDGRRGVVLSVNTASGPSMRAFDRFVDAAYCRARR